MLGLIVIGAVVFVFAGLVYRELELLVQSGPDALTTALRQLLGADSITVGDRTITVDELASRLQSAIAAFTQTPEGALRSAEQVLHTALDVVLTMIVTFYLLLDGGRFGDIALRFLEPSRSSPDEADRRPDPRRPRPLAARPARPRGPRRRDRVDRPRADPPPAVCDRARAS